MFRQKASTSGRVKPSSTFPAGFFRKPGAERESFRRSKTRSIRRLELQRETENITLELHGFVLVSHNLNHVSQLCSLHLNLL